MTTDSVRRTASDALLAKCSALDAGYRPVADGSHIGATNAPRNYGSLLHEMTNAAMASVGGVPPKRQSPLVNAGYAARIACTAHAVESFLSFHKSQRSRAQLVLLGGGLDVLGLWALSQFTETVKVFEVDTIEIINAKKELLESMQLLTNVTTTTTESNKNVLSMKGTLRMDGESSIEHSRTPNYAIASCNLKDITSVEDALADVDTDIPTLVLSELVLAYLGKQGIDRLLKWCCSNLCVARGSAFAAYEALGPSTKADAITRSVIDGYKHRYSMNFQKRLQRGRINDGHEFSDNDVFHPLGDCLGLVKKRLLASGFSLVLAGLAGTVAASVFDMDNKMKGGRCFRPREPFDEHAALTLHLHSYMFLCAFTGRTDVDLIRSMCPWSTISSFDVQPQDIRVNNDSSVCVRSIEASDQQSLQSLFLGSYKKLSETFSAVGKMTKTALSTDLKFSPNDVLSSIGLRYQTWGGVFLVAVASIAPDDLSSSRSVVGCLGIRRCEANEGDVRGGQETAFEIHRFAVDERCRGRGIGSALLRVAEEEYIQKEMCGNGSYSLVTTTPSLLEQANHFYTLSGFSLRKQDTIGDLIINTYVKEHIIESR